MDGVSLIVCLIVIIIIIVIICVAMSATTATSLMDAPASRQVEPSTWRIPKRIYQTQECQKVPQGMREAMQSLIDMNPDFGYKYYNDQSARTFIAKYMGPRELHAFDVLIPGAYRADLFRYCLLYVKGGVYIDSSMSAVIPLRECLTEEDTFVAPFDSPTADNAGRKIGIYNAFMAVAPNHPILRATLDLVLDRIDTQDIGTQSLYLTGPLALGLAFSTFYKAHHLEERTYAPGVHLFNHIPGKVLHGDQIVLLTKYTGYREDTKRYNSGEHYGDLWKRGEVFVKNLPTIPPGFSYKSFCPGGIGWDSNHRKFPQVSLEYQQLVPVNKHHVGTGTRQQHIPLIIHQTHEYDRIPLGMHTAMETITTLNPDYTRIYYSAEDRRKYIQSHMDARGVACYDALIPGAYKADFFRYCVLYYDGGVYMDASFVELKPLAEMISSTDKFVSAVDNDGRSVYNAFIAAIPQHPILGRAIELMLDRIERRDYGSSDLTITGPVLLREAFASVTQRSIYPGVHPNNIRLFQYKIDHRCSSGVIKQDGIEYFQNKYPQYRLDMSWYTTVENYAILWGERRVFK